MTLNELIEELSKMKDSFGDYNIVHEQIAGIIFPINHIAIIPYSKQIILESHESRRTDKATSTGS